LKNEKKMLENAKKDSTFNLYPVSKAEALKEYADNPYKTELIENLQLMEKSLSVSRQLHRPL
jgi:threonyl-tRNA synthetase